MDTLHLIKLQQEQISFLRENLMQANETILRILTLLGEHYPRDVQEILSQWKPDSGGQS